MTPTTFRAEPIPPDALAQLRDRDDAGRAPQRVRDADGGTPLRCCLRLSLPGEELALLSYAPLRRWAAARGADPGAYDETGPVFVHPAPCAGYDAEGWPPGLRGSARVLRGYSATGRIARAVQVPAHGPFEAAVDDLLADPVVAVVHARAADYGCFTFAVRRP